MLPGSSPGAPTKEITMDEKRYKELLERRKPSNPCPCGGYMSDWSSHASNCIEVNSKGGPGVIDYSKGRKDMTVNMNDFAKEVTLSEGKKSSVGIGDVKEILSITLTMLAKLKEDDLAELLNRYEE